MTAYRDNTLGAPGRTAVRLCSLHLGLFRFHKCSNTLDIKIRNHNPALHNMHYHLVGYVARILRGVVNIKLTVNHYSLVCIAVLHVCFLLGLFHECIIAIDPSTCSCVHGANILPAYLESKAQGTASSGASFYGAYLILICMGTVWGISALQKGSGWAPVLLPF